MMNLLFRSCNRKATRCPKDSGSLISWSFYQRIVRERQPPDCNEVPEGVGSMGTYSRGLNHRNATRLPERLRQRGQLVGLEFHSSQCDELSEQPGKMGSCVLC